MKENAMKGNAMKGNAMAEDVSESTVSRRRILAGAAAALGGGAIAGVARAFPGGAGGHFVAASEILGRYGVSVKGASANALVAHDVVTLEVEPLPNTQYDHLVGARNDAGAIVPCVKTSSFEGVEELSLFEPYESTEVPCWKTTRQGGVIVSDHFHPGAVSPPDPVHGEIVPCVRTTIVGDSLATFEGFDLTEGDIVPCVRVETEMFPNGALGDVVVTVDPELAGFTVQVGDLVYRLDGGELVLGRGSAS
jgi:hypothetical protein